MRLFLRGWVVLVELWGWGFGLVFGFAALGEGDPENEFRMTVGEFRMTVVESG